MPYYFFDTSALVKRYHDEVGTDTVDSVIEDEANTIVISSLAVIEATSEFRKRYNSGDLSEAGMRDLLTTFFDEALNDFVIVPMNDVALERAFDLVLRDDLRTLDSLQLSAALAFDADVEGCTFVCADLELIETAAEHELETVVPDGSDGS
jgi:predicted nucleic acid-binding protein